MEEIKHNCYCCSSNYIAGVASVAGTGASNSFGGGARPLLVSTERPELSSNANEFFTEELLNEIRAGRARVIERHRFRPIYRYDDPETGISYAVIKSRSGNLLILDTLDNIYNERYRWHRTGGYIERGSSEPIYDTSRRRTARATFRTLKR